MAPHNYFNLYYECYCHINEMQMNNSSVECGVTLRTEDCQSNNGGQIESPTDSSLSRTILRRILSSRSASVSTWGDRISGFINLIRCYNVLSLIQTRNERIRIRQLHAMLHESLMELLSVYCNMGLSVYDLYVSHPIRMGKKALYR